MSTRIRLRYSTVVNFASMIYRIVVAVGFVVIVARRLSVSEFGLWGVIFSVSSMLASLVMLWSSWAQRFYARGWKHAFGTGLFLTLFYALAGLLLYLAVSFLEYKIIGWGLYYMLLGAPLFVLFTLNSYFLGITNVSKPELRGYRGFLYDTIRLVLAYLFLVELRLGLEGALLSIELAMLIGVSYLVVELKRIGVFELSFSRKLAKDWLRAFYVPLAGMLAQFLRSGLRAIVSWASGSEIPVAYLNVGFAAESPVLQASQASVPALYARMLREKKGYDVEESLRLFFLFSGFMLATFVVLSKTIASLYNPRYIEAHLVIPLISFYAMILGIAGIYGTAIRGAEDVDREGLPPARRLLSSYLFRVPVFRLLSMLLVYAIIIPLLLHYRDDPLKSAMCVAVVLNIGAMILLVYFYTQAKRLVPHRFPWREALAILVGSVVAAGYYVVLGVNDILVYRFWEYAPRLLVHVIVALVLYGASIIVLSGWARRLVRDAIRFARARRGFAGIVEDMA